VVEAAEEFRMKPELTAPAEDEARVSTLSTLCTFIVSMREHAEHVEHMWVNRLAHTGEHLAGRGEDSPWLLSTQAWPATSLYVPRRKPWPCSRRTLT